ncbi:glutamine amidotransferase [Pseudoalteromonas sp. J010]|uniref:type 1 glutamine amidotransferase n=1 Tax=Pseudoalteromonas TaxID=53246 RepID=UPI000F64700A|nr:MULTISPECIES: type 1 glutamine amidotransferase [Pseudoalteromonas]MDW7548953.1 type 1 glutamine amidotransferase [Pseudoalteromonas peptidolytica]RRS08496.1 glutamine amidotransferase [Pseudoalteromonas sp. J010]
MNIHFIIHEHFEAPGAYEVWAEKRGHTITYSRVYQAEPLPKSIEDIDFLIVMGGPQDPSTTIEQCPHFDAKSEQAIILSSITAGKVVLGICLGAQLIGEALGATFEPSPEREIGKYPITLTEAGMQHPLFSHFGQVLDVGHWHNDMPGLTNGAQVIAYSEGCPRQIVAYQELVYGFQCHMELTKEVVALLMANEDLTKASHYRFVDEPEVLLNHDYQEMNQKLHDFLDKLERFYSNSLN